MDSLEAIEVVNERIKELETEQIATRVLSYVYLQDYPEQEMIRLALGPDSTIQNLILKAKAYLQLPSAGVDFPISPSVNSISISDPLLQCTRFSSASPRHLALSPWLAEARLWEYRETEQQAAHNSDSKVLSYSDRFHDQFMDLKDQFVPSDSVASGLGDYYCNETGLNNAILRNNQNVQSALKVPVQTCHCFIKGFYMHGNNCQYFHGQHIPKNYSHISGPKTNEFGYEDKVFLPGSLERLEMEIIELLKSRGGGPISVSSLPMLYFERYGRTIHVKDYITESSKLTKLLARLNYNIKLLYKPNGQNEILLAEHVQKYLGVGAKRNNPAPIVSGSCNIFFTFPVNSTFTKEDVSNYFSTFGPVADVRIPSYQKRVFGFVIFVSSDTVEIILARGNPHYVCGARVLVKPFKDKNILKRKDLEKLDSSLYYSHQMYANSELQATEARFLKTWMIEEHAKMVEIETMRLFNMNLSQSSNVNQSYFDHLTEEMRVSQDGHHAEINHSDSDRSEGFDLPDSIFGSASASSDSSDL